MESSKKKLGEYLVENSICDEAQLDRALHEQAELKSKGVFKPLGTLLTDSHAVPQESIDKVVSGIHLDILSASALFQSTSSDVLQKTLSRAQSRILPEDSVIFSQGDEPDSFFIVASGKVTIFRTSPEGQESTIANLGEGEGFGEVSLLTGEPHSASAKTVKPTSLIIFSKKELTNLIENHPDISLALIKGFASRLNRKDEEIVQAHENEKAYQQFVSQESELSLPDLIGQTRTINTLDFNKRLFQFRLKERTFGFKFIYQRNAQRIDEIDHRQRMSGNKTQLFV